MKNNKFYFRVIRVFFKIRRIYAIQSIHAIRTLTNDFIATIRAFLSTPNFTKALITAIMLYVIALFALFRGNIYYVDDFYHSIAGYVDANRFSRYIATFMLDWLGTFGKSSLDFAPLPQLFGAFFVIIASLILIYLIRKRFDTIGVLSALPLGLSPHFLENLSYRLDSFTMGFALFLVVFPFLFKSNVRIFCAVSVLCLILMLMTYQAANATYIILSLFFAFVSFIQGRGFKESARFLGLCGANTIIATALFTMLFLNHNLDYESTSYASHQMIALNGDFLPSVWGNLATYATTIFSDLKSTAYLWLIALICVLFVVNVVIYSNRPKSIAIFGAIAFIVLGFALSYGLYAVLEKPIFYPRAFYGFSALIAVIAITNLSCGDFLGSAFKNPPPLFVKITHCASCAVIVITAYFLISFANIYANALKKQEEYFDFRINLLLSDLSRVIPSTQNAMIDLETHIEYHAVAARFKARYSGISRIIKDIDKYDWLSRLRHYNFRYIYDAESCGIIREIIGDEIILQNTYHRISRAKHCYFIVAK